MNPFFFDTETRRTADLGVIERLQAAVKPPGNYKKPESIQQWWLEEGKALQLRAADSTALDGTYGRLASFAWARGHDKVRCVYGDDEVGMLNAAGQAFAEDSGIVVAFNADFDLRFLYQRMVINRVPVPSLLKKALHDRYAVYDPMREWSGWKGFVKQSELERVFDIPRDDDITGADIGETIDCGDWAAVERHNIADVEGLRDIYWRMI